MTKEVEERKWARTAEKRRRNERDGKWSSITKKNQSTRNEKGFTFWVAKNAIPKKTREKSLFCVTELASLMSCRPQKQQQQQRIKNGGAKKKNNEISRRFRWWFYRYCWFIINFYASFVLSFSSIPLFRSIGIYWPQTCDIIHYIHE